MIILIIYIIKIKILIFSNIIKKKFYITKAIIYACFIKIRLPEGSVVLLLNTKNFHLNLKYLKMLLKYLLASNFSNAFLASSNYNIILHLLQFSSHSFASLTSTSHFYPSYSNNKLILAVLQILVILIK